MRDAKCDEVAESECITALYSHKGVLIVAAHHPKTRGLHGLPVAAETRYNRKVDVC